MLPLLPAVLRYRAENLPDGFTLIPGPQGLVLSNPEGRTETFCGVEALSEARKRAWELHDTNERQYDEASKNGHPNG